ncbi:MAG: AMP-binding protein [Roseovarius sp.]|nr:AMP-binding protein [Roseovarius sp.]
MAATPTDTSTRATADASAQALFRWHPATRTFEGGSPAAPGGPLEQLHKAILGGRGFAVTPDGIGNDHACLPPGILHCQTGGTTGTPKLIERSHASWIASFAQNARAFGIGPGTGLACFGGLSHSLALYAAVEAVHLGANIHLLHGLRPRAQITELRQHGMAVLYATPAQLALLTTVQAALPSVRHVLCGGGQLGPDLRGKVRALCPNAQIAVFYGASETSFVTLSDSSTPAGSVGRAYGAAQIEIRSADGTPTNGTGEVWVSSPYLFGRYASGHSPETRRDCAFLTVGEMGWLDAGGHLYLAGRRDRMVRIAEQSVHPETLEALLLADPDVALACVLPRADAARGQVLVAVIAGADDPALAARLDHACRAAFGPLVAPRRYHFLPDFPLHAAGKPDLSRIAAWLDARE